MPQSDRNKSSNTSTDINPKTETDSTLTSTANISSPTAFIKDNAKRFKTKLIPQSMLSSVNNNSNVINLLPSSPFKSSASYWSINRNNIIILANASAIELYFLLVEDDIDAEKLCIKCSEKFLLTLTLSETIIQAPLIASCIQVLARLALKFPRLAHISVKHLADFLLDPSPILYKQYKHIADKLITKNEMKTKFQNENKGRLKKKVKY